MLFPTTIFAVFFLIVYAGHWLLRGRSIFWKPFLLAASYFFYGYWDWRFLGLIACSSIVNHMLAVAMWRTDKSKLHRLYVILAVVFNLGMLGFFKYYGFFIMSTYQLFARLNLQIALPLLDIVLPVGISFFTFQAMSYVLDVYRKEMEPAPHLIDFAVYLAFFPQLVAGPIVRASILLPQFSNPEPIEKLDLGRAGTLILAGLFKKIVIANYLAANIVDPVFQYPEAYGALDTLFAIYAYAIQIYCDFSAYSDIAIGIALLMGFHFPINFNAPYMATSIQHFWRRWHISLSSWLRDYLYIPLGGSRAGNLLTYRNLFLTFLLGGLWHGAGWTFIAWGFLHGLYLSVERLIGQLEGRRRLPEWRQSKVLKFGKVVLTIHLVCLSWIFFRAPSFEDAGIMLRQMLDWTPSEMITIPVLLAIVVGFCLQIFDGNRLERAWNRVSAWPIWVKGLVGAVILTVILALGPRGVAPFIYFQF